MKSRVFLALALLFLFLIPILRQIPQIDEMGLSGVASLLMILLALLFLALGFLTLGGMAWPLRLLSLVGLSGILFALFRVEGCQGEFLPQFAFRWSSEPGSALPPVGSTTDLAVPAVPEALDFPQFLGPDRSNWIDGQKLPPEWATRTPRELWRRDIGLGWSAFVVKGGRAITQEQRGAEEVVACYALADGAPLWTHSDTTRFSEEMGSDGPRATPVIHKNRVYSLGATGILNCLDLASGQLIWQVATLKPDGSDNLKWGKSASPLIVDDLVVVSLGRNAPGVAAYLQENGALKWQAGDDGAGYSAPILATVAQKRQVVVLHANSIGGYEPATGDEIWRYPVDGAAANVANPVPLGETDLLIALGYGKGARRISLSARSEDVAKLKGDLLWSSLKMKPKFTNLVIREGHAYGLDEARLGCIELVSGKRKWRGSRFGHGQVLGVGNFLLIQAESGKIAIARANPEEEEIVHEFEALNHK
ncbi:MAG: PQQ-binding-like beta-propeller repeat protein, partial [Verrucomicrobiota bacterium]